MLGVALGEIGMSLDDFDSLSLPEFSHVMEAYNHKVERDNKISWETARFMAMYFIQPYSKKPIKQTDICTFPWEKELEQVQDVDVKEVREDFKEMLATNQ